MRFMAGIREPITNNINTRGPGEYTMMRQGGKIMDTGDTIICLHAAASNIEAVDGVLRDAGFTVEHEVDTMLLAMIRGGEPVERQLNYVARRLQKLIERKPSCIFITCTNYIVLLDQIEVSRDVPILKIDELLFETLAGAEVPIKLLFTNEQTVAGTMERLMRYVGRPLNVEVVVVPRVFDMYITGDKVGHDAELSRVLAVLSAECTGDEVLAVAQLSMVGAADVFSEVRGVRVISPLTSFKEKNVRFTT